MTKREFKKWLDSDCDEVEIRYLNPEKKEGAYIPIGLIEQLLDNFDQWDTSDFKFNIYKTGNLWVASGSLVLTVHYGKPPTVISRVGGVSYQISSRDDNVDYEGTVLSFCLANAAKKLGKRFGRALNGRLDKGETSLPIIQVREPGAFNQEQYDLEWKELQEQLATFQYREDAQAYLDTTSFKFTMEAKALLKQMPLKSDYADAGKYS